MGTTTFTPNVEALASEHGQVFAEINKKPIRWTDKTGLTHICVGAEIHRSVVKLIWTLCGYDVPADKAWHPKSGDHYEICMTCAARARATITNGQLIALVPAGDADVS